MPKRRTNGEQTRGQAPILCQTLLSILKSCGHTKQTSKSVHARSCHFNCLKVRYLIQEESVWKMHSDFNGTAWIGFYDEFKQISL